MSYIGNEPIVSATRTITEITATAGQTVFVANGGYTVGYIDVFLNGAQLQTSDFTASNGSSITLTEAAQTGDVIRLVAWGTFSTATHVQKSGDTVTGGLNVLGNLGVGTSSPAVSIDARKASDVQIRAFETGLGVDTRVVSVGGAGQAGIIGTYSNHPLVVYTNGVERFRVPSNAGGIQFPATQVASSDANTLDDYEEGTFTPTVTFSTTTNVTYTIRNGWYTKVGRLVTVTMLINATTSGSSGFCTIQGLPFTSSAQSCGTFGGDGTTFSGAYLFLVMDSGNSLVYPAIQGGGTGGLGGWEYTYPGLWSAGGKYFNITYMAS